MWIADFDPGIHVFYDAGTYLLVASAGRIDNLVVSGQNGFYDHFIRRIISYIQHFLAPDYFGAHQ